MSFITLTIYPVCCGPLLDMRWRRPGSALGAKLTFTRKVVALGHPGFVASKLRHRAEMIIDVHSTRMMNQLHGAYFKPMAHAVSDFDPTRAYQQMARALMVPRHLLK